MSEEQSIAVKPVWSWKPSRVLDQLLARKSWSAVGLYMIGQSIYSGYRIWTGNLWMALPLEYVNLGVQVLVLFLLFLNRAQFNPRFVISYGDYGTNQMSIDEKRRVLVGASIKQRTAFKIVPHGIGFISKSDMIKIRLAA